jgi:hypothetical protein
MPSGNSVEEPGVVVSASVAIAALSTPISRPGATDWCFVRDCRIRESAVAGSISSAALPEGNCRICADTTGSSVVSPSPLRRFGRSVI